MLKILGIWIKEFRGLFLLFVTLPVILGSAIACVFYPAEFSLFYFALSMIAMLSLHAGTIIINDYFDFKSGTDVINEDRTPYSGGSGLLPEKMLRPYEVLAAGGMCFAVCIVIGMAIVIFRSPAVLAIGMIGVALGFFYTAPPFKLAYRGMGELARFVATPLMVIGALLVQAPVTSIQELEQFILPLTVAISSSIPIAFLNTAALYIFEFPDYKADVASGKRNLVVRLNTRNAVKLFIAMIAMAYISLIAGIAAGLLPLLSGIALVTAPLAASAMLGLMEYHDNPGKLVPYLKRTSDTYIIASIALIAAFVI